MKDSSPKSSKANRYSAVNRPPSFERAEVPSYMLKLEVDSIPTNTPFYIDTESEQPWSESPTMLVDKRTGSLYLDGSAEIDANNYKPSSPLGYVGIMRAETIDDSGIVSYFVADLRFIENHELSVIDDINNTPTDQEEFNSWMEVKETLRNVTAFIAPVPGAKASKDGVIPSLYYGPEQQYAMLDALRERGDKIIAKNLKQQQRQKKLAKKATEDTIPPVDSQSTEPETKSIRRKLFSRKK